MTRASVGVKIATCDGFPVRVWADRTGRWLRDRRASLRHTLEPLTIRAALFLGFGLIFGLWLISGFDLVRRLAEVESRASAINARFTKSEELLFTVRAQVLLGAVYVRDALLDIGFEEANYYRERLQATRTEIDQALQEYVPVMELPFERENWAVLQSEIGGLLECGLACTLLGSDAQILRSAHLPAVAR